jgi:hypothetical protein
VTRREADPLAQYRGGGSELVWFVRLRRLGTQPDQVGATDLVGDNADDFA